jgi:hypothetical protein
MWVYGDGSSFDLKVQLRDTQGEILQYRLGKIGPPGWQQLVAAINGPVEPGNRIRFVDGKLDGDITLQAIVIDDDPDTRTGEGVVYLDDLTGYSGPEAYAARFAAERGVVEVIWAVDSGRVRVPSADAEVTIIDRDGGSASLGRSRRDGDPRCWATSDLPSLSAGAASSLRRHRHLHPATG